MVGMSLKSRACWWLLSGACILHISAEPHWWQIVCAVKETDVVSILRDLGAEQCLRSRCKRLARASLRLWELFATTKILIVLHLRDTWMHSNIESMEVCAWTAQAHLLTLGFCLIFCCCRCKTRGSDVNPALSAALLLQSHCCPASQGIFEGPVFRTRCWHLLHSTYMFLCHIAFVLHAYGLTFMSGGAEGRWRSYKREELPSQWPLAVFRHLSAWNHRIFFKVTSGYFQPRLCRQKPHIFHEKSGKLLPCLCQRKKRTLFMRSREILMLITAFFLRA